MHRSKVVSQSLPPSGISALEFMGTPQPVQIAAPGCTAAPQLVQKFLEPLIGNPQLIQAYAFGSTGAPQFEQYINLSSIVVFNCDFLHLSHYFPMHRMSQDFLVPSCKLLCIHV
jgi:hypothetical protein